MAIGVGANTTIFSVVEGVLLKPLPYKQPDRLIGVWYKAPAINIPKINMAEYLYFTDREQSKTLEDIGLYGFLSFHITGGAEPEQVQGLEVTEGTLPILGVRPVLAVCSLNGMTRRTRLRPSSSLTNFGKSILAGMLQW